LIKCGDVSKLDVSVGYFFPDEMDVNFYMFGAGVGNRIGG